jgi:hypothetical protein
MGQSSGLPWSGTGVVRFGSARNDSTATGDTNTITRKPQGTTSGNTGRVRRDLEVQEPTKTRRASGLGNESFQVQVHIIFPGCQPL